MNPLLMRQASAIAATVYENFMEQVIERHVLAERIGHELNEKEKKSTTFNDTRQLYLMSISGKGGWDNDSQKRERYLKNQNITLLDHLLSVARGAIVLCALDTATSLGTDNLEAADEQALRNTLAVVAAIAFLHDLDKLLKLPRDAELTLAHIEQGLKRYGITEYLGDIKLNSEQIRVLIEQAEETQRHRHLSSTPIPRPYLTAVERYVKLADKLDGLWQAHSSQGGLEKIIERLNQDQSLATRLLAQWEALDIYDPHHPFLLDELQRRLSFACQRVAGVPPLLETHQDGRLFVLIPKTQAETIKGQAIAATLKKLPFPLTVRAPNLATPAIFEIRNARPTYTEFRAEFIDKAENLTSLGKVFTIKNTLVVPLTPLLDSCLASLGLAPQWTKESGQTRQLYADPHKLSAIAKEYFLQASVLALLLNLKVTTPKKVKVLSPEEREQALSILVNVPVPEWLSGIEFAESRRVLLSLWVTALSAQNPDLQARIWGETGLLSQWLEGTEQSVGFRDYFKLDHEPIAAAVELHLQQLLSKQRLHPLDETVEGHCLFTDFPSSSMVNENPEMHAINASAFTGREGKPDSLSAPANGQTPISSVSVVEHKLRNLAFKRQGGKADGVPTLVSSPITTGLFGALILNEDKDIQAVSIYQLASKDTVKTYYRGLEAYKNRCRLARLERIPEKIEDQLHSLRLMLQACLRIGRPIHIFRGLPTPQKAFFYFDAMPNVLKALLGFNELRLEQIPRALEQLHIAQTLIETNGLGYDVLNLYAYPRTRFGAVCLVWCHVQDRLKNANAQKAGALHQLGAWMYQEFYLLQEIQAMSTSDSALVRLGQAANQIQRRPQGVASTNEEMLVFNLCLDTAMGLRAINQIDSASLIHGIAGELETNLGRKDKMSASKFRDGQSLEMACMNFAAQFVHDIWLGVLQGKPPAQKSRRLLGSVYRMAFLQSFRHNLTDTAAESVTESV
jgi:hypothetical protein